MNQINMAFQKDLGYVFLPSRRHSEPGFSRLDIVLRAKPTEHHFDPHTVRVIVAQEHGPGYWMIQHPWSGNQSLRICAGQLDLIDRFDKRVEVFTFGGELEIDGSEDYTSVIITSPAPILVFHTKESAASLLAEEAEILIAERVAEDETEPGRFDIRLVSVEPMSLYRSILSAIQARVLDLPRNTGEIWLHFYAILKEETRYLEESLPNVPNKRLDEIL